MSIWAVILEAEWTRHNFKTASDLLRYRFIKLQKLFSKWL